MDPKKLPLISVIIPAYNAEATIRRACCSVLMQTYPNVEMIVVNDGSRDDTWQILQEFETAHGNVQCIDQENAGVSRARNVGIEHARGEFLAFLDADDELTPNCLERLYAIAEENGCAIATGNYAQIFPDGSVRGRAYSYQAPLRIWQGKEALEHALKDDPATYAIWGKLYRRAAVGEVRFVEGKRIHEDAFFLFQLFLRQPNMAVADEIVINRYMVDGSASRSGFSEKFLDILYFAKRKCEIVETEYPEYRDLAKNVLVKACLALLNVMRTNRDPQYREVEKECLTTVRENAAYFIPALRRDRRIFWIVELRLYGAYKAISRAYARLN